MAALSLAALSALGAVAATPAGAVTTWSPGGACATVQTTVVPVGVYYMTVDLTGGAGGKGAGQSSGTTGNGANGGEVIATIPVLPGQTISAVVGCNGAAGDGGNSDVDTPTTAGWSQGGGTGQGSNTAFYPNGAGGGGGGGSTAVCLGAICASGSGTTLAVAGGGGGSGSSSCAGTTGGDGGPGGYLGSAVAGGGGTGPTGSDGGVGASSGSADNGVAGGAGGKNSNGGSANGGSSPDGSGGLGVSVVGGGGGGGFRGGGAGANNNFGCAAGAAGGGGSSWVTDARDSEPTYKLGAAAKVVVTFANPVAAAPVMGAITGGNGQATVAWTAPKATQTITGYTVTPYVDGVAQTPQTFDSTLTKQTLTGLTNGVTYTFTVTTITVKGPAVPSLQSASIIVGAPAAPSLASASPLAASAKVSWHAPVANGGPITSYTITPYLGTVAQAPQVFASSAVTQTVVGLTNGSTYTFKVMATNAFGNSPISPASAALTIGVPGGVTGVTVLSGDFSAKIGWTGLTIGGGPIDKITVTPVTGGIAQADQVFANPVSPLTVTNVLNGETYTFKIVAHNAFGNGPIVTTAALVLGLPSPPGSVVATVGNAQATLTWHAPSNPGPAIMSYTITPYVGTFAQTPIETGTPALTAVVPGLANGTTYTFKVAAVNPVGTSSQSPASAAVVIGTPSAPSLASAVAQDGSAKVQWTALTDNGSPITSITVTPYISGVAQTPQVLPPTATKSVVVTGLTNGTAYTFRVFATNANGNGGLSSMTGAVTIGAPVTMSAPTVVAGAGQVKVTWKVPTSTNGSPVTGYVVTPYKAGVAQTPIVYASTALTQTITGLTPGTVYTFRVAATNARGTGPISAASAGATPT